MRVRKLVSVIALSLAVVAGPSFAEQNIDKVFGGITAEAGQEYGSLETVNGGITIRAGATVRSAETVNGGIDIDSEAIVGSAETVNGGIDVGADARVESLETVNGGIDLNRGAQVEEGVETVNGAIRLDDANRVGGDVATVNGAISVMASEVGGSLTTTNGDITLARGATVRGGILVEKSEGNWLRDNARTPRIVIGANCTVVGALVFEREVELFVHPTAKIGTVTGATAQSFTDALPARD
jgi:DUF4097 and DUF4098 domain-containing protein YvlB